MIYGFIHVYTVNDWKDIFERQVDRIVESGLYAEASKIFVGINGEERLGYWLTMSYPKFEILYQFSKPELEQSLTLTFARIFAMDKMETDIFYIHSKGVTHKNSRAQNDWREMMEYYVIDQYEVCRRELDEDADIAGVNWHLGEGWMGATAKKCGGITPTPHFSGNFWWATVEYLKDLPSLFPLVNKYQCEFWIGLNNPRVAELWRTGLHHHRVPHPKENYYGKVDVKYYD